MRVWGLPMRIVAERVPSGERKTVELPEGASGMDLLSVLGLAPDAHLLVRGDAPIPLDESLVEGETLLVIAVVSGGRV